MEIPGEKNVFQNFCKAPDRSLVPVRDTHEDVCIGPWLVESLVIVRFYVII